MDGCCLRRMSLVGIWREVSYEAREIWRMVRWMCFTLGLIFCARLMCQVRLDCEDVWYQESGKDVAIVEVTCRICMSFSQALSLS